MWGEVRNSMRPPRQVSPSPHPQSPPPPYKSRQNTPQRPRQVDSQPKDRNVYHGNSPQKQRYIGENGGNVRGGSCGECCLGACCCAGGAACFPFPGRDRNMEGCCAGSCCGGPCCYGCCCGEGVWGHLDPVPGKGRAVPGSCCGAPYESLNDTHKPRRCRRLGALLLFVALPLLLGIIGLGVYFGLQAAKTQGTKDSIEQQAPGGYYQDGIYYYPVPQDAVDKRYRVIGQQEIDECWRFLEEIGVTLTSTVNGSRTTPTPPTTVADTTLAATTEAMTTVVTTVAETTIDETTGTDATGTDPTVMVTTEEATTTVQMVTTVVTGEMTTETTITTTTSYMGTIPDCYALTTTLESMNTPMVISAGGSAVKACAMVVLLLLLAVLNM